METQRRFPAATSHGPCPITCGRGRRQSIWMHSCACAAERPAKHPSQLLVMPQGRHQAAKPAWPHPPHAPELYRPGGWAEKLQHPGTTALQRHCKHSQGDLPKLGSCREGKDPLNVVFINLDPLRSYQKLQHTPTAQG